jgi:hypothetical protein
MPELTKTSPNAHSRVHSNYTVHIYMGIGQPYARVALNSMPEATLFLFRDFGFGLKTFCPPFLLIQLPYNESQDTPQIEEVP